jgi:hypothetical protein
VFSALCSFIPDDEELHTEKARRYANTTLLTVRGGLKQHSISASVSQDYDL